MFHFEPFPTLELPNLILRKITAADADAFFELRSNPRIMQYLNRPTATTVDDVLNLIQTMTTNLENNTGITWGIAQKEDDTLIGTIGFWRIEAHNFRAEIGYLLHNDYQGRGWMSAALKKVIDYGFNHMNLHSIQANIDPRNTPSALLLEKNGFVREAYFKECIFENGVFSDTAVYSLLNRGY